MIETIAGEDLHPSAKVAIGHDGKAYKADPTEPSVVTCHCGDSSKHTLGEVMEFICPKSLHQISPIDGKTHKLVYLQI